ncbi:MAG: shikimate dehydrogenase [Myxococcales bacterium]
MSGRRVVTLPPGCEGGEALKFARRAKLAGAELLELRSDLHPGDALDAAALARLLPLLAAERGRDLASELRSAAAEVDRPLGGPADGATFLSYHADRPLPPDEAVAFWESHEPGARAIKHVEPLGAPGDGLRLLETQRKLGERFGAGRVTVLAVGPLALPFRCLLAAKNALDYLALDEHFLAAPGQRLLADAVRERAGSSGSSLVPRRGILGAGIAQSRSPQRHLQPFDRVDLPPDTELEPLLHALHPFYGGFAVTSPFKKAAARLAGSPLPAINTLLRAESGWVGANTDVDGARAVVRRLGVAELTALGDGGATAALREACAQEQVRLSVLRRGGLPGRPLTGTLLWTWPADLPPPEGLRFEHARVAVITYGARARQVSGAIRDRGGVPVGVGARWFAAQARGQARLWEAGR